MERRSPSARRAARRWHSLPALLVLLGCGAPPPREEIPFRYRQSMIEARRDRAELLTRPRSAQVTARRAPAPASACRALAGRAFGGPHSEALWRMLRACLGPTLARRAVRGVGLELRAEGPRPGDLVLFHNTRDENRNRRPDDHYTDAGVVVEADGPRVTFLYLAQGRARLGVLNLWQPNRRRLSGPSIQNTYLRTKSPSDPPRTRYLAGQLVAGFATWPRPGRAL